MEEKKQVLSNQELENANGGTTETGCILNRIYPGRDCLKAKCQYSNNNYCSFYNKEIPSDKPKPIVIT